MAKEKYEIVQKCLDDLLKRGFSLGEKFAVIYIPLIISLWRISVLTQQKCSSKAISLKENSKG